MIVLRLGEHHRDMHNCSELIEVIKAHPGCCDEVWIPSLYGFAPHDVHERALEAWRPAADALRAAGIKVSLQISNTIGHGQYMQSRDCSGLNYPGSKVRHMVGADGTVADYCYCYNDEVFCDYTKKTCAIYAKLLPDTVWVDDDLRAEWHAPTIYGCFCDDCVRRFCAMYGANMDRAQLVHEINRGEAIWRRRWIDFVRSSLYDFTLKITKAIMRVSPQSDMGYQYPAPSVYAGMDSACVFDAMRDGSGRAPKSRGGFGFYDDEDPSEMIRKAYRVHYCNHALPQYVNERWPEIENTPDVPFGKTIFGTLTESTLYIAYGCNALTYAALMTPYEPISWHEGLLRGFERYRPLWARMIQAGRGTKLGGAAIALDEALLLRELAADEPDFEWAQHMWHDAVGPAFYGLPLGFDADSAQVMLLTEKLARMLPEAAVRKLMTRPVLTESTAAAILMERGFDLGLEMQALDITTARERFTVPDGKGGSIVQTWGAGFADLKRKLLTGKNFVPTSEYISGVGESVYGNAGGILSLREGGRWAIVGSGLTATVISSARRAHILGMADAICDNKLPALAVNADKLVVIPRVDEGGMLTSVSILHHGIGRTEDDVELRLRAPRCMRFTYMDHSHPECELAHERCGDEYIVRIPALDGWDMGVVFCDR